MGFLSHRFADSGEHSDQCSPAFAEHLSCVVVEGLGFFPGSNARGSAVGGFAGAAGGVAAGATGCGSGTGGFLCRGADGALSHLVCAEHSGTRGYFFRGLRPVGPFVSTSRPPSETTPRALLASARV